MDDDTASGNDEFGRIYPVLARLLTDGAQLDVNTGGFPLQLAGLYYGEMVICQFVSDGMTASEVFAHLEELAARYENEGIVTDEINGEEYATW